MRARSFALIGLFKALYAMAGVEPVSIYEPPVRRGRSQRQKRKRIRWTKAGSRKN